MQLTKPIPSLHGFRAISIVLVILGHELLTTKVPPHLEFLAENLALAGLGVSFFFVISGFLITYLLLVEKEQYKVIDLKAFYIRRLLRIFPAFYFFLGVLAILNAFSYIQVPSIMQLSAALYIHNFAPWGQNWYIEHSWSLSVEEQFYLIWPFLFINLPSLRSKRALLASILIGCIVRSINYKYPEIGPYILSPFLMHSDLLFVGCWVAYHFFYHRDKVYTWIEGIQPAFAYLSIVILFLISRFEYHPVADVILIPTAGLVRDICIPFLLIYFIIKESSLGFKFLNHRVMIFIGSISFSLYLWQQLFISRAGMWISTFPQNIFFSFAAAIASYYLIELPFLRLKQYFREKKR